MRRRSVILALAGVLVVGIVTPVLAHNRHAGVERALDRAKKAKQIAKDARQTAQQAVTLAQQAGQGGSPGGPSIVSGKESGTVTTDESDFVSLGGPTVTVTVPASGLIEVWGQADIGAADGGAVGLYEDGQPVPGQSEFCGTGDPGEDGLFAFLGGFDPSDPPVTSGTPAVPGVFSCGSSGPASPVLFERPPGEHTYELRYAQCICGGTAEFSNRVLRVGPRL